MNSATFMIAAGGTGGHVFPGIEVARRLRQRHHRCVFLGTRQGQESRLVPRAGFEIEFLRTGAWQGQSILRRMKTLVRMPLGLIEAGSILDRNRPAAVLSLGGYSSAPLMLMALLREIPLVIMEPNAKPGLANRLAGPFAARALVAFPQARSYFAAGRGEVSGIPIRKEFFELQPRTGRSPFTVLITGGSQGARSLNQAVVEALPSWRAGAGPSELRILHQTGERDFERVRSAYGTIDEGWRVDAFFHDMPAQFAEADLIVCRAGASAVAELCAAGKASILVPYPRAADQHQLLNARAQEQAGAAIVVLDRELSGKRLAEQVSCLRKNPALLARMEKAAQSRAQPGAAERAADLLEQFASLTRARVA